MPGVWQQLAHPPAFAASTALLLTDGTVMCQSENSAAWWKLTPDRFGSYVNGSWSRLASMSSARLYYTSALLADGRVLVAGGEYAGSNTVVDLDSAEIYDPILDSWTAIPTPGWGWLGDASSCLLADGRLLIGSIKDPRTALFDPASQSWAQTGSKAARCDEETWTLLPDGAVFTVDCEGHPNAEKYIAPDGHWVAAGATPVELVQASSIEIGPAVLLPDGRVFCVGATGHTALYTPGPSPGDPGTWAMGPDFPADEQGRLQKAKDAPACLLPNGRVLCTAGPAGDGADDYPATTHFFEFDGTSLAAVPDAPNGRTNIYAGRLLLLPTGEVLFIAGSADAYVYQPDGAPADVWRPAITACPSAFAVGSTQELLGRQLNGVSQAVSYGDDAQAATNYPLVAIKDGDAGTVTYCRTSGHSTMGVATRALEVSTSFTTPPTLNPGSYELHVVANGIWSDPVPVNVLPAAIDSRSMPRPVPLIR